MEITKVQVWKNKSETFVANCSVEFDDVFFVKCKVVKSSKDGSLFISWPNTKGKDADGNDKYFPDAGFVLGEDEETKYDFKNAIDDQIIKEYNKVVGIDSGTKNGKKDETPPADPTPTKKTPDIKFGPKK
jgi:DNA-binding cell septation regulator SpoVG